VFASMTARKRHNPRKGTVVPPGPLSGRARGSPRRGPRRPPSRTAPKGPPGRRSRNLRRTYKPSIQRTGVHGSSLGGRGTGSGFIDQVFRKHEGAEGLNSPLTYTQLVVYKRTSFAYRFAHSCGKEWFGTPGFLGAFFIKLIFRVECLGGSLAPRNRRSLVSGAFKACHPITATHTLRQHRRGVGAHRW